jgi:hypothetical protein
MKFIRIFSISLSIFVLLFLITCKKEGGLFSGHADQNAIPRDFLSSAKYDKLIIDLVYVNGYAPDAATITNVQAFLGQRINKPGGISVVQTAINPTGISAYSVNDIKKVESEKRTKHSSGSTLTAFIFFADGASSDDSNNSKILGVAYGSTSMAIFSKTIKSYSGGIGQPSVSMLETTVTEHEFGHLFGLVNNGTAMQSNHQDVSNGRHCSVKFCLMYYATETSNVVSNLLGGGIPELDSQCKADLKANGGK